MSARGGVPGIEDRMAIDDLYSEYLWALDTHDIDRYVGTFWPDARFVETQLDGTVETWTGAPSIRAFSEGHFGGYRGHQHRESNRLYTAGEAGRSWDVRSYWFTSHREAGSGEVSFSSTGHSRDVVECRDGQWRFVQRWVERWPGDVAHPLAEAQAGANAEATAGAGA
ncbi:nuclear transport factor 2 family protein [Herbiconiux sp. CPCC 203407]|uniref:Nuclear transport factor 2 family protein n=1 Tax=Herbiconiux oxytropis TaxID=2970915 RepID=A0AA42BUV3_9MICO|nr:nuclear transport factor 2 family protein [Herbiconiux oxytropis]MCS5722167.1 nuclear transport factor 2 family protein [Herbiconiux oxytropis]MCS5725749.1 nuclear transport factor 2 family protein [Herbiconiux oxytropis]